MNQFKRVQGILFFSVSALVAGTAGQVRAEPYNWARGGVSQATTLGQWEAAQSYPLIDGTGVTIAVIDSGIDLTRSWFQPKNRSVEAYDFVSGYGTRIYGNTDTIAGGGWAGHGSACSAFAAGGGGLSESNTFRGIAPGANLLFLRVNPFDSSTMARALQWLNESSNHRGVSVISMSLGWGSGGSQLPALFNGGVFMSVAGGNDYPYIDDSLPYVFRVGGSTLAGTAPGQKNGLGSAGGPGIKFMAPAVDLWVGYPGAVDPASASFGTSWATPQVAGLAALIKQVKPSATPNEIRDIIAGTGTSTSVRDKYGYLYPVINVKRALDRICAQVAQNALCTGNTSVTNPNPTPPVENYESCALKSPQGSWIRESYLAGGSNTWSRLGCPTTREIVPADHASDGRYAYQEFEKGGLCMAWDWNRPNNYVPGNYIIMSCTQVRGRVATGNGGPTRVQDCPLYATTMTTPGSWIAQSFMNQAERDFGILGCPTGPETSPKPGDGRYAYQRFERGCMAWDWSKPTNYVPGNYIPKTSGCP
jgi:hypothetical protein